MIPPYTMMRIDKAMQSSSGAPTARNLELLKIKKVPNTIKPHPQNMENIVPPIPGPDIWFLSWKILV
jgi:hypothetical protein